MTPRARKILAILLIAVIIAGVGIATYFMFFRKTDNALRVRRLGGEEIVDHRVSYYSNSRLALYSYGAFEVEIIRTIGEENEVIFVGIGTFVKTQSAYTFTYTDNYVLEGTELVQRPSHTADPYLIAKGGRIQFRDHTGILYYFGK